MEGAENKEFVYEFGRFVLNPREKTLFSGGVPLRLPAKEFETLLLLVENNGRALSKEEMMSAIWPEAFVEESNLSKQISRLRKIFNTGGEEYIETLPKHGYRFSTDIKRVYPLDLTGPDPASVPVEDAARTSLMTPRRIITATVALLVVAAIGWIAYSRFAKTPAPSIRTIAVLPLKPLSPSEENQAIGIGLTDSLITRLGSLKHLVVRPISSVSSFTGDEDAAEIGRRLKVDAVLIGSIQGANGRLRINARLIDTSSGEQIWADKFDDNLTNIFEVQDRLSEQAARALTETLTGASHEPLTKRYTANPAAFDAYLKGRYYLNKRSEEDFRRATGYFDEAVRIDPNYALAYSGLADCYILLAVWGTEAPAVSFAKAKDAALKALAADADLAEAHTSLAFIKWVYDWNFAEAGDEFDLAIKLNPNYATAHHWRSYYLVSVGRSDEAVAEIKKAQELEGPLSIGIMTDIGEIYCWAGLYDQAIQHLGDVTKLEPNYAIAHYVLGIADLKKGLLKEAVAELERARELENNPRISSVLSFAYGAGGEPEKAKQLINELEAAAKQRYVSPFSLAVAYTGLGENDNAIEQLERAYAERSDAMAILSVHPLLRSLHGDPRFDALVKKVEAGR